MEAWNCLPRLEDKTNLNYLINNMNANKCVAFIGAGVSVNKGYRSWSDLLFDSAKSTKSPGLLSFSKIDPSKVNSFTFPQIVDFCIKKIGKSKFRQFIKEEYGRKDTEYSENHLLICKSNFQSIITTNFDPCLYDNAESLISSMKTYPGNSLEIQSTRTLYNIHGRAFLEKMENPNKIDTLIDNLIFGHESFKNAYDDSLEILLFIYSLLKRYKLIFIGYSMNDELFMRMLKSVSLARTKFLKEIAEINSMPDFKNEIGVILLEFPSWVLMKLQKFEKDKDSKEKKELINKLTAFYEKEKELSQIGFKVIGYDKINSTHRGLTIILELIKKQAQLPGLNKPTEKLDAYLAASISGSML